MEQPTPRDGGVPAPAAGWIERACTLAVSLALIAMVTVITVDVFTRSALGFSYQISDELCGYLLVAATFLSVPVAFARGAFHRVELIQSRLSPRRRLLSQIVFEFLALAVCAILDWQFLRLELSAWHSGSMAPSIMMTPLWIPQLSLPIGMSLLCILLVCSIIVRLIQLKSVSATPATRAR